MFIDKMPTLTELMKLVGCERRSCGYSTSRTVLKNLNKPVLAYGVGYAGFIAVFQDGLGQVKGTAYSIGRKENWPFAVFLPLDWEDAINRIQKNNLFKFKEADMDAVRKANKEIKRFIRPILGTITCGSSSYSNSDYQYRFLRLKNKKVRIENNRWRSNFRGISISTFLDDYYDARDKKGGSMIISQDVPKEVIEEIEAMHLASKI